MKREIKFRGKDIETDKWVDGDLIQRMGYMPSIMFPYESNGKVRYGECAVKRETVGQFTGLLDKNGKEIYEGDIVKTKGGWGGVVLWNSRGYFYVKDNNYSEDEEPDLYPLGSMLCCIIKRLEIIGNIHDNPELIKD
jgi:uncharacterized phage protein (TIGR01671 family)